MSVHISKAEEREDPILPHPEACYGGVGPWVIPIMDDEYGGVIAWATTTEQAERIVDALNPQPGAKQTMVTLRVYDDQHGREWWQALGLPDPVRWSLEETFAEGVFPTAVIEEVVKS